MSFFFFSRSDLLPLVSLWLFSLVYDCVTIVKCNWTSGATVDGLGITVQDEQVELLAYSDMLQVRLRFVVMFPSHIIVEQSLGVQALWRHQEEVFKFSSPEKSRTLVLHSTGSGKTAAVLSSTFYEVKLKELKGQPGHCLHQHPEGQCPYPQQGDANSPISL